MSQPLAAGQVVTVFRNRLRPDADAYEVGYSADAARMWELASSLPGFVDAKVFTADDGERVNVVTFADEASQRAWREHPEHRAAQRRGVAGYYETYSIQVATVSYVSSA